MSTSWFDPNLRKAKHSRGLGEVKASFSVVFLYALQNRYLKILLKLAAWLNTTETEKMSLFLYVGNFFCIFCVSFCDRMIGPCIQCISIGTCWLQNIWSIVLDIIVRPFLLSAGKCCGGFSIHLAKEWHPEMQIKTVWVDWASVCTDWCFFGISLRCVFFLLHVFHC